MSITRKIEVRASEGPHITKRDLRAFLAELGDAPDETVIEADTTIRKRAVTALRAEVREEA